MKKKSMLLIAVVLLSAIFISGCTSDSTIKTAEEATETLTNISQDVGDVSGVLQELDNALGGL